LFVTVLRGDVQDLWKLLALLSRHDYTRHKDFKDDQTLEQIVKRVVDASHHTFGVVEGIVPPKAIPVRRYNIIHQYRYGEERVEDEVDCLVLNKLV
jgi:hypothetical protein